MLKFGSPFILFLIIIAFFVVRAENGCTTGCNVALASYLVIYSGFTLSNVASFFNIPDDQISKRISAYNPNFIGSEDTDLQGQTINVSFPCDCINGAFLGQSFSLVYINGDFDAIALDAYANLTTTEWLAKTNPHVNPAHYDGSVVDVIINCSCGDPSISKEYGLFLTYPLRPHDNLALLSQEFNLSKDLIQKYNPGANFSRGKGIIFLPTQGGWNFKDTPLKRRSWVQTSLISNKVIS